MSRKPGVVADLPDVGRNRRTYPADRAYVTKRRARPIRSSPGPLAGVTTGGRIPHEVTMSAAYGTYPVAMMGTRPTYAKDGLLSISVPWR